MKAAQGQLELELRGAQHCRSLRRVRKSTRAQTWFEKMRQAADDAMERPPTLGDSNKLLR